MKYLVSILFISFCIGYTTWSQTHDTPLQFVKDSASGEELILGKCTFEDLKEFATMKWQFEQPTDPAIAEELIDSLKIKLLNTKAVIFLGTWCSDSQELIPQLFKLLGHTNYPFDNISMYGLDKHKTHPSGIEKSYSIMYVPTVIFYRDDKELGRIVESPHESLEKDILSILQN
jgi:thiol-disulfide isomerase/thioredoxin